jgi:hypothetical protein
MYAAQQSSIDPALAALMQTAQMVTPDNTPTVAAQVAQAAAQKQQAPAGISALMPGVQQQAMNVAQASQPATQGDINQLRQQMQQSDGVAGLPAPNMQEMAEGGVVGFAGDEFGSYVSDPAAIAMDELRSAEFQRKRREDYQRQKAANEEYRANIARQKQEEQQRAQVEFLEQAQAGGAAGEAAAALRRQMTTSSPQVDFRDSRYRTTELRKGEEGVAEKIGPAPLNKKPEIQFLTAQPAAGIEQLVEPKFRGEGIPTAGQGIMTEAQDSVKRLRDIEEARAAAKGKMPDLNERGIAALQRAEEERKRLAEIDRSDDERRRWAGVFRGWGGDRDAYDRILTGIASRDSAANRAQLEFDQAQIKLQQAQQAEALGQFDRKAALEKEAAELMTKARKNALDAQQIAANLATSQFATEANLFNTKSSAQQRGLDRVQQAQIEGAKLKQQAEQNNQMKLANLINSANITVNSAIEKMEKTLANKYGAMINIINTMTPEMLQKQPQMAATYDAYLKDKDALYKQTVEPAVMQRNRLASQVSGAQDLSKWGEPTVKKGG